MLSELTTRGLPWGIVTNKVEFLSFPILEKTGWLSSAAAVICGDTVPFSKPHPEPVLAACRSLGVEPLNTLMVGDDLRDIEAGERAGSRTAFALYGYARQGSQLEISDRTALINKPEDVLGLLETTGSW